MPIAVRVVSEADFNTWLAQAKARYGMNDSAPPLAVAAAGKAD
jgi:heme/copper-type cytochrome/quinol oxidase subunit 2